MGGGVLGLAVGLSVLAAGCGGSGVSEGPGDFQAAPEDQMTVSSPLSETFVSASPARIKATLGDTALVSVGLSAHHGDELFTVIGMLAPETWGAKTVNLTASTGPTDDGFASVQTSGIAPDLREGTISLTFGPGTIYGEMRLGASRALWTLTGTLSVECWIPRPAGVPVVNGVDGPGALIADATLADPRCAPFRALAGR
jgi:hypothetical protein